MACETRSTRGCGGVEMDFARVDRPCATDWAIRQMLILVPGLRGSISRGRGGARGGGEELGRPVGVASADGVGQLLVAGDQKLPKVLIGDIAVEQENVDL